jgi:hypothetical protein
MRLATYANVNCMKSLFVIFLTLLVVGCSISDTRDSVSVDVKKSEYGTITVVVSGAGEISEEKMNKYLHKKFSEICGNKAYEILPEKYGVLISEGRKLPNTTSFLEGVGSCLK